MPEINEIQPGKLIGKNYCHKFIWLECPDCKKVRWVLLRNGNPVHILCNKCGQKVRYDPIEKRIWQHVDKIGKTNKECWLWTGSTANTITNSSEYKYGTFWNGTKMVIANRFIYEMTHNTKLDDNIHICHKCDNPLCVNPDHLFLGTQRDNMKDHFNKHGVSKNYCRSLTIEKVKEIKEKLKDYKYGLSVKLAKEYKVNPNTIRSIKNRLIWKDI